MIAILAMLAACALLAGTTLIAKMLGAGPDGLGLHPLQVTAGRFIFAWLAIAAFAAFRPPDFVGTQWRIHAVRSVLGWLSGLFLFAAATMMPLASATALSFLSPVVTMVCAIVMLSERVGVWRWSAAAIALTGALVLIRPGTEAFQIGALVALASALAMGLESIFIKRLSDTEPPVRILLVNNSIGLVVATASAALVWQWPTAEGWTLMAALGVTMIAAQAMFIQAMRRSDASHVVPLFYTILIFSGLLDYAIFAVVPDATSWIGAGLIVAGAVVISVRGRQRPG